MTRRSTAILISGSGSNMVALARAMQASDAPARIDLVLSNRPDAGGLQKAADMGIATAMIDHRMFKGDRAAFDAAVDQALKAAGIELVALAGFMRILTAEMVGRWSGRMLNIHPSLLPAFKGLRTHEAALEARCSLHGCTVHEVSPDLDAGQILGQAAVPVLTSDTTDSLAARVLEMEHRLYPQVLERFARDPEATRREPVAFAHWNMPIASR
ncbi:MAG: phosphoribosylglycinamide formyltransferase [Pseudomonadota bacterium]